MEDETRESDRLSVRTKVAYGAPVFASAALAIPIGIHMTKFYADQVLVPLGALGVAIAVARAFDAITDPMMGWISDRTRTRWGRRRPYLLIGAPFCGLAFVALFSPPRSLGSESGFVWFTTTYLLYYLFHTVYLIPHHALGAELTLDYHERSSLFSYREAFLLGGTLFAAVAPGVLSDRIGDERTAYTGFAILLAVLMVLLYGTLAAVIRERSDFARRPSNPFVPGVRRALRNRPFRILLLSQIFAGIPGSLIGTLLPFYIAYVLRPENEGLWLSYFLGGYFGSALLMLPAWLRAAHRFGKQPSLLAALAIAGGSIAVLVSVGPDQVVLALLLLCLSGSAFGALTFLGIAMKADVIDYDELHTGKRREAQFTSFWAIIQKFAQLPSAAVPIAVLGTIGYVPNQEQTQEVVLAIRLLVGLTPLVSLGAAFVVLLRYPISPAVHRAIRDGIAEHARGRACLDPLTGETVEPPARSGVDSDESWYLDHFSTGELRRARTGGSRRLRFDTAAAAVGSLAIAILAASAASEAFSVTTKPGLGVVLGVLVAGVGLAAFGFHAVRFMAARRFHGGHLAAPPLAAPPGRARGLGSQLRGS